MQFDPVHGGIGGVPRLYVATGRESRHGDGSRLHALDSARDGRTWTFDVEDRRFLPPLAATDDAVRALDPETGDQGWQFAPGTDIVGPATAGDVAFVGVDGAVQALDGSRTR